ncbi:hypothetical protein JCM10213_002100 [Rhodosporidiobolus nylandii]
MSPSTISNFGDRKVKALVTGASGLVGSAIAVHFLRAGHTVRLALRKQEQADAWQQQYGSQFPGQIESFVYKGDIGDEGVFDEAVQGVEVIVHAASPGFLTAEDGERDILKPAVNGTLSILKSAKKAASVKSFVYTSSIAAYTSTKDAWTDNLALRLNDKSWNRVTYEEAAKMPISEAGEIYAASKAAAEQAAWNFAKQSDVHFTLASVAPSFTLGRDYTPGVRSLKDLHSTLGMFVAFLWDKEAFPPLSGKDVFRPDIFVSVDDVARAHVAAALNPSRSNGHRYFLVTARTGWEQLVRKIIEVKPELKGHFPAPPKQDPERTTRYTYEADGITKDLGVVYSSLDELVKPFADQVYELAKADGAL